ncbi:MAG: phage portal protein [Candidatus Rokuibacteriota bacterium]
MLGFESSESLNAPAELLEQLAGLSSSKVARSAALSVPTVLRARNKIAGTIATLPINVHDRTLALDERNTVVANPDPDLPPIFTYAQTAEDLLFEAKSYWRVLRISAEGFPVEARHIDLRSVSQHAILGMPSEILSPDLMFTPRDPIFVDGVPAGRGEIIRFVSPNPPLLVHAARAIRTILVLDKVAEIYANEPVPLGYFTDREDADPLGDTEVTEVLNDWATARRTRAWGYVPWALDLNTLQLTPEQLQLVGSRQHAVLEVIRATGLDPVDVGVDVTTSHTYQNAEERRMAQLDALTPYMGAIEQRLSMNDVLPRGLSARFDASGFLRTAFKDRMEGYEKAKATAAMTEDEIRRAEYRPPLTPAEKAALRPPPPPQLQPETANGNGREPVEVTGNGR